MVCMCQLLSVYPLMEIVMLLLGCCECVQWTWTYRRHLAKLMSSLLGKPKWEVIALSLCLFIMSSRGQKTTTRVLFSHRVVPGGRSQVIRLDSKGPPPLSHFASPWSNSIFSFLGDFLKIFTVAVLIHWELCCCLCAWLVFMGCENYMQVRKETNRTGLECSRLVLSSWAISCHLKGKYHWATKIINFCIYLYVHKWCWLGKAYWFYFTGAPRTCRRCLQN